MSTDTEQLAQAVKAALEIAEQLRADQVPEITIAAGLMAQAIHCYERHGFDPADITGLCQAVINHHTKRRAN